MKADSLRNYLHRQIPRRFAIVAVAVASTAFVAVAFMQVCCPHEPSAEDLQAQWVQLADRVHELKARGMHGEALRVAKRSLKMAEKVYGPLHPATGEALNELAQLLVEGSQFEHVNAIYRRAIGIQSRVSGPESPEVAALTNNLAQACEKRGQFTEAESLYKKALAIYEQAVGFDDPATARVVNNLACLEDARCNHAVAEPLHRRAHGPRSGSRSCPSRYGRVVGKPCKQCEVSRRSRDS